MSEASKLAKAVIPVFLLFVVALLAEILLVVWRRRVSHQQDLSRTTSNLDHGGAKILCCSKTQSRVGDSNEASQVLDDPIDVFKLRDMSRLLFTIKEEEEEEEEEEGKEDLESQKLREIDEENEDTFSTPCVSPSYFSPIASPASNANAVGGTLHI